MADLSLTTYDELITQYLQLCSRLIATANIVLSVRSSGVPFEQEQALAHQQQILKEISDLLEQGQAGTLQLIRDERSRLRTSMIANIEHAPQAYHQRRMQSAELRVYLGHLSLDLTMILNALPSLLKNHLPNEPEA